MKLFEEEGFALRLILDILLRLDEESVKFDDRIILSEKVEQK